MGGFSTALSRHYLHPEIKVSELESQNKLSLGEFSDDILEIDSDDVSLSPSQWHPEFGVSVPNFCLQENLEFNSLKNCCRLKFISN